MASMGRQAKEVLISRSGQTHPLFFSARSRTARCKRPSFGERCITASNLSIGLPAGQRTPSGSLRPVHPPF